MNRASATRPAVALSDLSVTEFLTLSRMAFLPHVLVVGAEKMSDYVDPTDRSISFLLGDGAGASACAMAQRNRDTGGQAAQEDLRRAGRDRAHVQGPECRRV